MKHPTQEQWLDYVYSENSESERAQLDAHLQSCEQCRTRVQQWQSAQQSLNEYDVAGRPRAVASPRIGWRWGAAAAVLLLLGVTIGRLSVDTRGMRADIVAEMNAELGSQLDSLVREIRTTRLADREATLNLLEQFEMRRLASESLMRQELETVAINTQTRLQRSEQRLRVFDESVNNLVPVTYQPPN